MSDNNEAKFDLNFHTFRLLQSEPFFAALSRRIHKSPTKSIPTAGVCINPVTAQFEMVYNPDFMSKLSDVEKLGVMKHEFYHIIFEHVTGRLPAEGMSMAWNVATDLAINSHLIGELPEGGCIPSKVGTPFEGYPVGLSAEAYYEMVKNDDQFKQDPEDGEGDDQEGEGQGEGQGQGQGDDQEGEGQGQGKGKGKPSLKDYNLDDHGGWGEASEEAKAMAKERLKDAVEKAAKEASAKGWGSVSASTRKQIMDMITAKVDWRKVLRYFIKQSQRADKRSTVRRLNKRFPYIHAGKKVRRQANIAISIDQSGSVSDQMLAAFFAELNGLASLASFTVIPFDSAVDESLIYEWRKGQRRTWERVMCGGTDFNAPTEYVNKHGFDGHLILSDMEAPKPKPSKCQRIWFTDRRGKENPYFTTNERVIAIDLE
jgi:predicted metal-dependent peptidase